MNNSGYDNDNYNVMLVQDLKVMLVYWSDTHLKKQFSYPLPQNYMETII